MRTHFCFQIKFGAIFPPKSLFKLRHSLQTFRDVKKLFGRGIKQNS